MLLKIKLQKMQIYSAFNKCIPLSFILNDDILNDE